MALAIFNYINKHMDLNNEMLNIGHFLYYFRLDRSSWNNKPPKLDVKKGKKVDKGEADKGKVLADEPKDKDKWLRWYIPC